MASSLVTSGTSGAVFTRGAAILEGLKLTWTQPCAAQGLTTPRNAALGPMQAATQKRLSCRAAAMASTYDWSSGRQDFGVKVFEQGKQQAKQVVAETLVRAPVEQVWRVLTDYEALPSFIPNLERCERLANAPPGRIRLRQLGCSQGALWRLEAEAVLEVEEVAGPLGRREARFTMVEGDFKQLSGRWIVEPDPSSAAGMSSILRYEVSLQPDLPLPNSIVSYVVRAGLPANIKAVAQRAEAVATSRLGASGLASWAGVEEDPPLPFDSAAAEAEQQAAATRSNVVAQTRNGPRAMADGNERLPTKGPFWPAGSPFAAAAPLTGEQQRRRAAAAAARSVYLGTTWVPLPPAGQRDPGVKELLDEQLKEKQRLQNLYPAFGLKRAGDGGRASSPRNSIEGSNGTAALRADAPSRGLQSLPAEVHLRRLDGLDFLHRRAVAAITVDAPASAVWEVLTDYDGLADFIPNLAASERIRLPASAPNNVVRVRQVGYKRMPFLCFHAESVLDLIEKPQSEIQFRQVAGDFERFQGKWMLQEVPCDSDAVAAGYFGPQTQLKYAVEFIIPRTTGMLGVVEPLLERVVFEDVPANLGAVKHRVEALLKERRLAALEEGGNSERAAAMRKKLLRPRLADMVDDFSILAAELERCFGKEGSLPTRNMLRDMNRTDLEKAIAAHGGPTAVAESLGWKVKGKSRKPRGYWDALPNVKQEVDDFIEEYGMQPGMMPLKNDFIRAGRFDLARAVERWGGLYELAAELDYEVASPVFSGTEWQEHISEVAASTGLSGKQGLFELAARTYRRNSDEEQGESAAGRTSRSRSMGRERKRAYAEMPSVRSEIDGW